MEAGPNHFNPLIFIVFSRNWNIELSTLSLISELLRKISYHILPVLRKQWFSNTYSPQRPYFRDVWYNQLYCILSRWWMLRRRHRCLRVAVYPLAYVRTFCSIYYGLVRCIYPNNETYLLHTVTAKLHLHVTWRLALPNSPMGCTRWLTWSQRSIDTCKVSGLGIL